MSGTSNTQLKTEIEEIKIKMSCHEQYQEKMLMKLTGIENLLAGTEYDQMNGGGLVKKVNKNEQKCNDLIIWKEKTNTRNAIIWIGVASGLTALWGLMVANWGKIFN